MTTTAVDPRIPRPTRHPQLAPRPATLAGRTVLLFDNGKLGAAYGPYHAVFEVLRERLPQQFDDVTLVERSDDLLRGDVHRLAEVARQVADSGVDAVVFALCDWGVSQPTAIVAAHLEQRGVPTSVLATGVGVSQVLATAAGMCPGLPVTELRSLRSATVESLRAETESLLQDVVDGLVQDGRALHDRFARHQIKAASSAEPSGLIDLDDADPSAAFTEAMRAGNLGDGLPLVAPTTDRVERFLAAAGAGPDDEIWPQVPPRSSPVTAREVAAVAVAAGCRSRWAPAVLAAYRAMAADEFRLFQAAITTHPGGTLVLVSGPDAERLGYASGRGALGPGFAANATTGRAVALGYSFLLGAVPGGCDLTAQGSPAEYSYCAAENLAESPWPGLHAELASTEHTTVTVLKCEGPHNMLDQQSTEPDRLLGTFASTMATLGSNAAYVVGAQTVLLLNPEHARLLAGAGWSRGDVQSYLFDAARNPRGDLAGRGIGPIWPTWFDRAERVPVVPTAEDLLVVVTGGAGPASQVAIPWGYSRAVTRVVGDS